MIYNNGRTDTTDNYFKLAIATVRLASVDYINAIRYIRKHSDKNDTEQDRIRLREKKHTVKECERFFHDGLFSIATDFPAADFINRLRIIANQSDTLITWKTLRDMGSAFDGTKRVEKGYLNR